MSLKLGDTFPDFAADTSAGRIDSFHQWIGDSWAILFSHPRDFTPVCTTELARVVALNPEFKKRNVKTIALSYDSVDSHRAWTDDVIAYCRQATGKDGDCCVGDGECKTLPYPIIADEKRELAVKFGMLDPDELDDKGVPLTCRAVFVIGPDKKVKLSILYPATTGRNFDEILRVIDSLQLTAVKKVATPADWKAGDDCMVVPSLSDAEAKSLFPHGFRTVEVPSGKQYVRITKQRQ